MKNLNLIKPEGNKDYPTNALVLLSSNESFFEYARVKCARFKENDVGEFIDQKEFAGALYEQVDKAIKFAKQYIAKNGRIKDLQRVDEYEIPIVAIREALVNAVVHRDYGILGADIKMAIFDDRLEITSPGALPKTLEVEDILEGRSEIRNRVIAKFFKEINYIEQWGTGIRRMIKECDERGLIFPTIKETGYFFKVILYRTQDKTPISADKTPISADKTPISADKTPISADKTLSENEKIIVEYLESDYIITNQIARELIGLKETATKNLLKKMCEKQILVAKGDGRGRKYHLSSKL
jgi:ATP-dependent DNA helicase RecG